MRTGSGISLLLGVGAFIVVGLFTKDWTNALIIGLGLAGFGGLGTALSRGRRGGTLPGSRQPQQPKNPGRSNEL